MLLTGGATVAAALAAHSVDTVFGIPGTHNLPIYAALPGLGIRHVLVRHEQGAGYAADGYARSTGRPGVVLTTTGPAVLNAAAAAAQAYSDSVPVFFLAPGMPTTHPAFGNGLLHELRDQLGVMRSLLATTARVTTVAEIPGAVAALWNEMLIGRPRPVFLEIPLDLLDEVADVRLPTPVALPRSQPDPQALARAAEALAGAREVVAILGGGAAAAPDAVRTLVERCDAAVVMTANGKGVLPSGHPATVATGVSHVGVSDLVRTADVVLAIGTELAPSDWWSGFPELEGTLVRLDVDPVGILSGREPDLAVLGDVRASAPALIELIPARPATGPSAEGARTAREVRAATGEWTELIAALADVVPRDAIVAADNAMVVYFGALGGLPSDRPRGFLYPTGAGTLGFALPAGIGAKIADPSADVLVIQGDGGIMFTVAELATAADQRFALPILVVDNGGYGEIRYEMQERTDPVHAVDLAPVDFVALARAMGCDAVAVTSAGEAAAAVRDAFRADHPRVIHLRVTDRGR